MTLLVSSAGEPASLTQAVRGIIRELDPKVPVNDVQDAARSLQHSLYPFRLLAL